MGRGGVVLPRLTRSRRRLVEGWMGRYPKPVALVVRMWPGLWRACRAAKMTPGEVESAALAGVCKAARKFREDGGASFDTYAALWVRAAVGLDLHNSEMARAGRHGGLVYHFSQKEYRDRRRADGHRTPRPHDVADPAAEAEAWERAEAREARDRARALLADLPDRLREVLTMRLGLDGGPPLKLADVGERLGVTRERARQLEAAGLARCRRAAGVG